MSSPKGRTDLPSGTLQGWPHRLVTSLGRLVLGAILPFRVVGGELVPPDGPLLVVANHLSNADPPLLILAFPRPLYFLGKSELFRIPMLDWLLRRFGGIPVKRGTADRAAFRQALEVMRQGLAVGIFPEGGRSRTCAMSPAYAGVGLLALQSQAPILPVGISGTEFYAVNGEMPPQRPKNSPRGVTIQFGAPFQIPGNVDGRRVTSDEATLLIMSRVSELLPEQYRGAYGESH